MTTYKKGEVILVPFPFSDQSATKKRPAVIISSDNYHRIFSDLIIMAITSKTDSSFEFGESVIENWKDAGLLKPSAIKPVISTIEKNLILKKIGNLSEDDLFNLETTIKKILDIK